MKNRSQKIRLGIFLVISTTILLVIIGFFTARQFFKKHDTYYISYEGISVSGLEVGSPVKYMGIKVGTIDDISIDPEDVNKVIIEIALKPGTPIKEDAEADITSIGITGLKTIEISGGTNEAKSLEPESFINAGTSITEAITGKAEIIAEKAEAVLNNLQVFTQPENLNKITTLAEKIGLLADRVGETIQKFDTVVTENRSSIRGSVTAISEITQRLNESSKSLQQTVERINILIDSDTIGDILTNIRDISSKLKDAEVGEMIVNIAKAANKTQELLIKVDSDIDRSSQDFSESLRLLKMTLENLNEASRKINDDPSILIRGVNQKDIPDQDLKD